MQQALTEAGYVGDDVENILVRLLQIADYDIYQAQTGIIYIDEIDKVGRKSCKPINYEGCLWRRSSAGIIENT